MSTRRIAFVILLSGMIGVSATTSRAQQTSPQRKAGWWQMTAQLPGGKSLTRNLCLDATSDARNDIFKAQPGCTMSARSVSGGYAYERTCEGTTTTGTAIGDFNSAYKIVESRGTLKISTDARWMGACPAGRRTDELWMGG